MSSSRALLGALLLVPLFGCPAANDDATPGDDDDSSADDDDATADDDDTTGDDDDATGDDDDSSADDDDSSADDDDSCADDDDSSGDDDDTVALCSPSDLTAAIEVRTGLALPRVLFDVSDELVFVVIVSNPCAEDVQITAISTCLVSSWDLISATGTTMSGEVACGDSLSTYLVPANDAIETSLIWGQLPAGSWTLTATLDVPEPADPSATFVVQ